VKTFYSAYDLLCALQFLIDGIFEDPKGRTFGTR